MWVQSVKPSFWCYRDLTCLFVNRKVIWTFTLIYQTDDMYTQLTEPWSICHYRGGHQTKDVKMPRVQHLQISTRIRPDVTE